jgi:hypothetical protein
MRAFAAVDDDPAVSLQHGVLAGSVLWAVRDDAASPDLHAALTGITGGDITPLAALLSQISDADPVRTARLLTERAGTDPVARELLDRVVLYFLDDYLQSGLLRRAPGGITVTGDVTGTNVVIGGNQYIGGDLVITRARAWSCPTAPNPPPHFAGRRDELDRLNAALAEGRSIAVTGVQGMGGIGKTALVLQAAAELRVFGAVLWASLGPEPTVVNHLVGWARHGDDAFEAGDSPLDVLTARVQSALTQLVREHCPGRVLVILDDVWEGESLAAARILQRAAPAGAAQLITTRSQKVVAQLRSTRLELRPMLPADALQMLRNLLAEYPEISDTDLAALAEAVGYHPLALELAAGQVQLRERPADEITDLIEKYRRGVPAGSPFGQIDLELGETREDSLDVVLAYSYDGLAEADRAHFRALGILAYGAPFDRGVCGALWGQDATPGLDALRHRALLGIAPEPGWYQQHQLLRAYARALLNRDETERTAIADRYAEHLVGVTGQFAEFPADRWRPLEPFLPHVEEVGAFLVAATDGEPSATTASRGLTFAANTRYLLARRRELRHAEWLEMGLSISKRRLDLGHVSLFLNELGQDELFRGRQQEAVRRFNEALDISERTGDRARLALTYVSLGSFFLSSDPEVAPRYLRQAVELYEGLGDAAGTVTALLLLAQWHTTLTAPHEQRKEGEAVLARAARVAAAADNEEGEAEALLQLGRLYDTTGHRARALPLLEETIQRLHRIGRSDLEALGRLFSASAAAALGRLDAAEMHLRAAIPLFRTTGHGTGQATALRNLAELRARHGDPGAALNLFADALPLVRRVTMEFLDVDHRERQVAVPFFWAQYEEVVKLDLVEAFRANVAGEDFSPPRGWIAEECLYYLLRETARASADAAAQDAWTSALEALVARLTALAPSFDDEKAFAEALRQLAHGGNPELGEGNVYRTYLSHLQARIEDAGTRQGRPLIEDEPAREYASNTLAAKLFEPEQARDWAIHLRRQRRLSGQWGDVAEHDFYDALLRVLAGRPAALRSDNPYCRYLDRLSAQQASYEVLPVDWMLRESVAAALDPGQRADWLEWLAGAADESLVYGSTDEEALLRALAALVAGEDAYLPADQPFRAAFERARGAVTAGQPLIVPLPAAEVEYLVLRVVDARTTEPKAVDTVRADVENRQAHAERVRDRSAAAFQDALLRVLDGGPARLADDNPYAAAITQVANRIADTAAVAPDTFTLPADQLDLLTVAAAAAADRTSAKRAAALDFLDSRRTRFADRGQGWEAETALVDGLLAIAAGREPVQTGGPYASVLEKTAATVARHQRIRAAGGRLDPAFVDKLLQQTAEQVTGVKELMERQFNSGDLASILTDSEFAAKVAEQRQWATALAQQQAEFAAGEPAAPDEAALFEALVAITDSQPVTLPSGNPYFSAVSELLAAIDYAPGIPYETQLSALALDQEAHQEEFGRLISGRAQLLRRLDDLLAGTVRARTTSPDDRARWSGVLERSRARLASSAARLSDDEAGRELELLDALSAVLDERPAGLPADHPYRAHLDGVEKAVAAFHAATPEPGHFPGETIADLYLITGSVIAAAPENRQEWRDMVAQLRSEAADRGLAAEAVDFLDALLIVMDGRPADLPPHNRYRPYLTMTLQLVRGPSSRSHP